MSRGRYSRGYVPHIDESNATQFITWRLGDSLPRELIEALDLDTKNLLPADAKRKRLSGIEVLLDAGYGSKVLENPQAAKVVQEEILAGDGVRYRVYAWCIMPTHVHVVLTPLHGCTLGTILQGLKGRTSREIGKQGPHVKPLWQREYFDRFIRDEAHFERVVAYIERNPVKAGLCQDGSLWPYSSGNPAVWNRLVNMRTHTVRGADLSD